MRRTPDHLTPEQRSRNMAKVRGRDTRPELKVRRALFAAGFRYRLHARNLPGHPDIVLARYRTAVFVHGCFWHGHGCRRSRRPRSNQEFWDRKLDRNLARDRRSQEDLAKAGYRVFVLWECELPSAIEKLIQELADLRVSERYPPSKSEKAGTIRESPPGTWIAGGAPST